MLRKILSTTNYSYLNIKRALALKDSLPEFRSGRITIDSIMVERKSGKSGFEESVRLYNAEKAALEVARVRELFSRGNINPRKYLLEKPKIKADRIVREKVEKCVRLMSRYRSKRLTDFM